MLKNTYNTKMLYTRFSPFLLGQNWPIIAVRRLKANNGQLIHDSDSKYCKILSLCLYWVKNFRKMKKNCAKYHIFISENYLVWKSDLCVEKVKLVCFWGSTKSKIKLVWKRVLADFSCVFRLVWFWRTLLPYTTIKFFSCDKTFIPIF